MLPALWGGGTDSTALVAAAGHVVILNWDEKMLDSELMVAFFSLKFDIVYVNIKIGCDLKAYLKVYIIYDHHIN